jgi:integrase
MSLYKRGGSPYWWTRFTVDGRRIQQSTGTCDKKEAQEYEAKLRADHWEHRRLGVKPKRFWKEAALQWLKETSHKATHESDKRKLRWLDKFLGDKTLDQIDRELLMQISERKARESSQVTANRYMALVRAILRKAANEWEWMDREPKVRMYRENGRRVRFLTREEAARLLKELPPHLAEIARFALATGLRRANITGLEWSQVDMKRCLAWVHPDQAKGRKAIAVPLNSDAIQILERQAGKHATRVFTYNKKPVFQLATRAWQKALKRAGIENFRFHDLRHTWASWHVQAGTSLYALQEMGGWQSAEMVRRYAHFQPGEHLLAASRAIEGASENLKVATAVETASDVTVDATQPLEPIRGIEGAAIGTKMATVTEAVFGATDDDDKPLKTLEILVAREGIEPPTRGFSVRCSTN